MAVIHHFIHEHPEKLVERPTPISRSELKKQQKEAKRAEREKEKATKVSTKEQTYLLYKEGKSIAEIATIRGLSPTTIEGHLAHYIGLGELSLDQFVPQVKARRIREVLRHTPELSIAKAILGDDVTYGEIQMVMAVKS